MSLCSIFSVLGRRDDYLITRSRLIRSYTIAEYLKKHRIRKLQIGAGDNVLKGWLNADLLPKSEQVVFLDARRPFPMKDGVFDYVFSEHQIEHLHFKEALFMLREINRILRPNGKVRIATPDLATLIRIYSSLKRNPMKKKYVKWISDTGRNMFLPEAVGYGNSECFVLNNAFRNWGHQFLYDRATLRAVMANAGFVEINSYLPGESDDEVFRNIESHGRAIGNEDVNRFETMVLEGRRA